ncbi:MAG TPA: response regulator [Gemmatimonadaceae bacterium]|nr:response regulator [Gemmatimonadaceae bacterium]
MTAVRRVLVADDEPLARERLRQLLARHPSYEVIAECTDGDEALAAIAAQRPDVAFLDIAMPGRTGVEVASELLDDAQAPAIVFVTAYDQFALRAFEVSAIDYLVKPVDRERFDQMLDRVERRVDRSGPAALDDDVRALLHELRLTSGLPKRFVVRTPRGHYFVRSEDIETATAEGNYVALAAGGRVHLVRETMKSFELKVDPARFVRIHRSTIVCVDRIARVEALGHGAYRITMQSGARFDSSPTYGQRILSLLR